MRRHPLLRVEESLNDKLDGMSKDIREMKDPFAKLVDFYITRDSQKS